MRYGFVAKETISSLVLDIAVRTEKLRSNLPEIPASFRLNNTLPLDVESKLHNKINLPRLIRKANFHLLQLARPEYIFFCRQLPATYVHEYMLEQEHLSFIRFFQHAVNQRSNVPMQNRKWCVFMRTSGELLRLCSDRVLQSLFVTKSGNGPLKIDFFELSSVQSLENCRFLIEEFSKNANALVCVANMNVCTVSQVNVCRHFISTYLADNHEVFVTLVLHYPPEMNLSDQPNYHAIYVDNWNFVYIDSVGFTTGHETNLGVLDVDARSWLAKGFGLSIEIPEDSLVNSFTSRFFQYLQHCCIDMVVHPTSCKLSHSQHFYAHATAETRFHFLQEIFDKFPFALKEILQNFSKTWTPSLLYSILSVECEQLQLGRTTNSILHRMHSAIKNTLFPLVVRVTKAICSNYALEAISSIGDDTDKQELFRLILKTFTPPPLSDILNQNLDKIVIVNSQFPFPPSTVLFDSLSGSLLTFLHTARAESQNDDKLSTNFKQLVQNSPIYPAVNFINSHHNLLVSFQHDFVRRTLQLPNMHGEWLELFITLLDKLKCGSDICNLYPLIHHNILSSLGVLLHPLLDVKEPTEIIESFYSCISRFDFNPSDLTKVKREIFELTITNLWNRLLHLCTDSNKVLIDNWIHVFHQFHIQFSQRSSLILRLTEQLRHCDTMAIVFYFLLATGSRGVALQAAGETIKNFATTIPKNSPMALEDYFCFIDSLCSILRECRAPYIVTFLQEICTYFLNVKTGKLSPKQSSQLTCNFGSLLCLWTKPEDSHWAMIPSFWKLWTISGLLLNNYIYELLFEKSYMVIGEIDVNLSYTPKLLHNQLCNKSGTGLIEDAVFFSLLHNTSQEYEKKSLDELCELYPTVTEHKSSTVRYIFYKTALSIVILHKLAKLLSSSLLLPEKTAEICKQIINNQYDLYLLQQVQPQTELCALVKHNVMDLLGLDKWKATGNIFKIQPYYLFSFMIEQQSDLGQFYAQVQRNIRQGKDYFFKSIKKDIHTSQTVRYQYRMSILLVSYYDFFNKNIECTALLNLLEDPDFTKLLDINAQETLLYKMFAEIPKHWSPMDILMYQFSSNARKDNADCTIAHIMVNCMAVALGSPRDSNHFYMRAFDMSQAATSFSPGSSYKHKMTDSGYLFQADGTLTPSNVMGNHQAYRLILNMLVWVAFSWHCVIDPVNGPKMCQSINGFLTYWKEDTEMETRFMFGAKLPNRNEDEKIRFYIMARVHRFFQAFSHNTEMCNQHIDSVHFITESLLQMWKEIDNNGLPSARHCAWRGFYSSETEAMEYEDILKRTVFDVVHQRYSHLKDAYQEVAEQNSHLKQIFSVQNVQAQRFESPLVSFDVFQTYVADQMSISKKGDQSREKVAALNLVAYFMREQKKLRVMKYLPSLTQFYKLLHTALAFKITLEEAQALTVPECLKQTSANLLNDHWEKFKKIWKEIREAFKEIEGCTDQMVHRAFESELLEVDDSTLLTRMLSHPNVDENDEIYRVILLMVKTQEDILIQKDQYQYQNTSVLNLEHLSAYSVQDMIVMGNYNASEFEDFVMSQMTMDDNYTRSSVSFDIPKIAQHISEKILFGKVSFNCNNFRKEFAFKNKEEIGYENNRFAVSTRAQKLRTLADKIQRTKYDKELNNDRLLVAQNNFFSCNETELESLVELFIHLIEKVLEKDKNLDQTVFTNMLLQSAAKEWLNNPQIPVLKGEFFLANLYQLSEMAADMVREERALFADSRAMEPVSQETKDEFIKFEQELLDNHTSRADTELWLAFLNRITRLLLNKREMLRRHQPPTDQILKLFGNQVKTISEEFGAPVSSNWKMAIPSGFVVTQVRTYILFLYRLCGDLLKKNKPETSMQPYNEKTPNDFGSLQNTNTVVSIPTRDVEETSPLVLPLTPAALPSQLDIFDLDSRSPSPSLSSDSEDRITTSTTIDTQHKLPLIRHNNGTTKLAEFIIDNSNTASINSASTTRAPPNQQPLDPPVPLITALPSGDANFSARPKPNPVVNNTNTKTPNIPLSSKSDIGVASTVHSRAVIPGSNKALLTKPQLPGVQTTVPSSKSPNSGAKRAPNVPLSSKSNDNINRNGAANDTKPESKGLILVTVEYFNGLVLKYKPARDSAANTLYEKIVSDVKKKKANLVPFHLTNALEQILPNSADCKLSFCIPSDTKSQLTLKARPGTPVCYQFYYSGVTSEYYFTPLTSIAIIYKVTENRFSLNAGTFTIAWEKRVIPNSDTALLEDHITSSDPVIKLFVQQGVEICIFAPTGNQLHLREPLDTPIDILFQQIAEQLSTDYNFFLSPDQLSLISPNSEKTIQDVIGEDHSHSRVELHILKMDSIIRVHICFEHDILNIIGIPLATSLGKLWQILDGFFPDKVAFPRGFFYVRRALDISDETLLDSEHVSTFAQNSELFVDLIPKSSAIFTSFIVDDQRTEAICAYPDLEMGTLLELVPAIGSLQFVDPDGVEIDLSGDEASATVLEYTELLRKNGYSGEYFEFHAVTTPSDALQFVVYNDEHSYTFTYEDEAQLTTMGLLEIVRKSIPVEESEEYMFCANGITLNDELVAAQVIQGVPLVLVSAKTLITISIELSDNTTQLQIAASTTTIHQIAQSLSLPPSLLLFSRGIALAPDLPLSEAFGLTLDEENEKHLVLVAREDYVIKPLRFTLVYQEQNIDVLILADTKLTVLTDYARFMFQIDERKIVDLTDEEGFKYMVGNIGEIEEGERTLVVYVTDADEVSME